MLQILKYAKKTVSSFLHLMFNFELNLGFQQV